MPKLWVVIGVGVAGVLILAEVHRRRLRARSSIREDFGAFVNRFELLPFAQLPPPAAPLSLSGLTFAINDKHKGKQWNKAANYYREAIELSEANATYYCNRAATCLESGYFQQAEEDCSKAISLDKKNVKAYLRHRAAREALLLHREALEDLKHALVLEPQNKAAGAAELCLAVSLSSSAEAFEVL